MIRCFYIKTNSIGDVFLYRFDIAGTLQNARKTNCQPMYLCVLRKGPCAVLKSMECCRINETAMSAPVLRRFEDGSLDSFDNIGMLKNPMKTACQPHVLMRFGCGPCAMLALLGCYKMLGKLIIITCT